MEKRKISLEEVIDFVMASDSEMSDLEEENSDENETLDTTSLAFGSCGTIKKRTCKKLGFN